LHGAFDDKLQFLFRPSHLASGLGVTSKRRLRLYSASLPNLLRSEDCERDFFITVLALGASHSIHVEDGHYGRMVAGSNLSVYRALRRLRSQDSVARTQSSRQPILRWRMLRQVPGEQIFIIGVQRTPNIYETL
jgi:hypothetical protein